MRVILYCFKLLWLDFQYGRKLAAVQRNRWLDNPYGTTYKQRQLVHNWFNAKRKQLQQLHEGVK